MEGARAVALSARGARLAAVLYQKVSATRA